jgi:hypothetical protein
MRCVRNSLFFTLFLAHLISINAWSTGSLLEIDDGEKNTPAISSLPSNQQDIKLADLTLQGLESPKWASAITTISIYNRVKQRYETDHSDICLDLETDLSKLSGFESAELINQIKQGREFLNNVEAISEAFVWKCDSGASPFYKFVDKISPLGNTRMVARLYLSDIMKLYKEEEVRGLKIWLLAYLTEEDSKTLLKWCDDCLSRDFMVSIQARSNVPIKEINIGTRPGATLALMYFSLFTYLFFEQKIAPEICNVLKRRFADVVYREGIISQIMTHPKLRPLSLEFIYCAENLVTEVCMLILKALHWIHFQNERQTQKKVEYDL